ncbi:type II toxin-antitoxin system RelE/ParE family toxin [Marivirga sp.]|uniref:type II toxin-antitoxin system RelE/ParE family toxin n=1 Tax=Marivirga sp. TaxID=2018662 RepID=UPI003DA77D8E
MKIVFKDTFLNRLANQVDFIAEDSPNRAKNFKNQLLKEIKKIKAFPYKHRQSIYFEDENIRDLIYKGYTVVYRIKDDEIGVFGFIKHQKNPTD